MMTIKDKLDSAIKISEVLLNSTMSLEGDAHNQSDVSRVLSLTSERANLIVELFEWEPQETLLQHAEKLERLLILNQALLARYSKNREEILGLVSNKIKGNQVAIA